jgi:RNA polymerase sigma-70 factor, ECF subfamily
VLLVISIDEAGGDDMKQNEFVQQTEYSSDMFEQLIDLYGEKLTRLAYTYVKDWGKSEDIVQDTFISFYEKQSQFRGDCSVKNWLFKITVNRCKDVLKSSAYKKMIFLNILDHVMPTNNNTPEIKLVVNEEYEQLAKHVMKLPVKYRECIILYYQEELTVPEISQLLSMKEATIKTRLHRARQQLKISMQDEVKQ